MISPVHNSIHPPELEEGEDSVGRTLPASLSGTFLQGRKGVVNQCLELAWDGDTRNPLTLRNALVDVQLHIASDPQGVPLGNATWGMLHPKRKEKE